MSAVPTISVPKLNNLSPPGIPVPATVINVDSKGTTFSLSCAASESVSGATCALQGESYTIGPSTVDWIGTLGETNTTTVYPTYTTSYHCSVSRSSLVWCAETGIAGIRADDPATTFTTSSFRWDYQKLVIVAGAELLSSGSAAMTTGAASSGSSAQSIASSAPKTFPAAPSSTKSEIPATATGNGEPAVASRSHLQGLMLGAVGVLFLVPVFVL